MTPAAAIERATPSISSYGVARRTVAGTPLSAEDLRKIHACWRACNYLMLGMIYLQDNPLLNEPLKAEHIKNRLRGPARVISIQPS
jgi:xylulose-5-phosphate/fructose-6-phosphate phosphoketolase